MTAQAGRRVTVEVPATTANLGAGFDALGLALDMTNSIDLEVTDASGYQVVIDGLASGHLPRDETHLVIRTALRFYDAAGIQRPTGLRLHQTIGVPLSGGLGSSATAIVGGLLAASALSGAHWGIDEILHLACEIEGHPDNVAPALLGGLVAAVRTESGRVCAVSVPVNEAWRPAAVLAVPDFELSTHEARSVLRSVVELREATYNIGRAALFVAAAASGRTDCLAECMSDRLHQASRSRLIPGLNQVFVDALAAGALGTSLSGAGPTVLALVEPHRAEAVGEAMRQAFAAAGVRTEIHHTTPRFDGATVQVHEDTY